ncbi:MAG: hypothetical protein AAGG51_23345 [Cyanobacteria bacterium P01_G01_bin.54]
MEMAQVVTTLKGLADQQALKMNALQSCHQALKQCILDDREVGEKELGGWLLDEIKLHFDKISLVFEHDILKYPYTDTKIGLYVDDPTSVYLRALKPIGHYRLITLLNGEVEDTYLVIEVEKADA